MRKNANFANHKCALRRILLINMLKLKQLVSNLYHFAFGKEVHTNGMNADGYYECGGWRSYVECNSVERS